MPIKVKQTVLSIVFLCTYSLAAAQAVQTKQANYRDPVLDRQFGIIAEVRARPDGTEGTHYLSQEWHMATIYLKSGDTLKNFPLRYNIEQRNIEIQVKEVSKILPGEKVIGFEWQEKPGQQASFINSDCYTLDGVPLVGIFEILTAGDIQLLSRATLERKKSDYNVALDVGSKSERLIKKETLYLAKDKMLTELKGKEEYIFFGTKQEMMKAFAKANKLKLSRKEDTVRLLKYYYTL